MLTLLILFTILNVLALIPASLIAMFAPMAFDAPGSNEDPRVWLIFGVFYFAPYLILLCLVGSLLLYWRGHRQPGVIAAAAPSALIVILIGLLLATGAFNT